MKIFNTENAQTTPDIQPTGNIAKAGKGRILRRIATITMAVGLIFGAGALTACNSSSLTPSTNPEDSDQPSGSSYSQILIDMMNSDYYTDVFDRYNNSQVPHLSPLLASIPYSFLTKEGYDITAIKSDQLECKSVAYMKEAEPNNVYLSTRVETEAAAPYYTNYVLKYALSDQEVDDFKMLHENKYIQAGFFVQELDNQKTATVVSDAKITVEAYNSLNEYFNSRSLIKTLFNNKRVDFELTSFSKDDQSIDFTIRSHPDLGHNSANMHMVDDGLMSYLKLTPSINYIATINNTIYTGPCRLFTCLNNDQFETEYDNITYYDSNINRPDVRFTIDNINT